MHNNTNTVATIVANTARLGHSAQTAAWAIELATKGRCRAMCCWCLEKVDPCGELSAHRVPKGGDCCGCAYSGRDTVVVVG